MNICHICGIPQDAGFFDESDIKDGARTRVKRLSWPAMSCTAITAAC